MIREAKLEDLQILPKLAKTVREDMVLQGLNQWVDGYPGYSNFYNDYHSKGLFVFVENNEIVGSISILPENDIAYKEVTWEKHKSLVVHRIMVNPLLQGKGIGKELLNYSINKGRFTGYESIKIDTHPDNVKMQKMLKLMGFAYRGYLSSINRLAFEFVL